jgi:hypothetical protein
MLPWLRGLSSTRQDRRIDSGSRNNLTVDHALSPVTSCLGWPSPDHLLVCVSAGWSTKRLCPKLDMHIIPTELQICRTTVNQRSMARAFQLAAVSVGGPVWARALCFLCFLCLLLSFFLRDDVRPGFDITNPSPSPISRSASGPGDVGGGDWAGVLLGVQQWQRRARGGQRGVFGWRGWAALSGRSQLGSSRWQPKAL